MSVFDPDDASLDLDSLYTEDEVADACEQTATLAYAKGLEAGRRAERRERGAMLKALAECNGSTEAVVQFLLKSWEESQHPRDHGKFASKAGEAGEAHPVQGGTRAEQMRTFNAAQSSGKPDPLGVLNAGWPKGIDRETVEPVLLQAIGAHESQTSVGPELSKLYAAVAERTGLSKHEFLQALGALVAEKKLSFSKWSKTVSDIPDHQLVAVRADTPVPFIYSYVHAGPKAQEYAGLGGEAAPQPAVTQTPVAPATAPAESPLDKDAAHYAKLVGEGEERAAKAFIAFVARTRNLPKDKVAEHFARTVKKSHYDDEHGIKRDHGKFSATEGGKGDERNGTTTNGTGEHDSAPVHGGGDPARSVGREDAIEAKAQSLASRIADVPAHIASRVSAWLQSKYERLSARYGPTGAKAILGAMVLLAPAPIPGTSLLPVAIAEAVLRIRTAIGKGFDPNEPRDKKGEWVEGGTAADGATSESMAKPAMSTDAALAALEKLKMGYAPGQAKWNPISYLHGALNRAGFNGEEVVKVLQDSGHLVPMKGNPDGALLNPKKAPAPTPGAGLPPNIKTGGKGGAQSVPISKITFPQKWNPEITPLKSNDDKPIIVYPKTDGTYQLVDGFGRTSGLYNAGQKKVRVIVVTDKDVLENTKGQRQHPSDDAEWVAKMYAKYAPGIEPPGTTN